MIHFPSICTGFGYTCNDVLAIIYIAEVNINGSESVKKRGVWIISFETISPLLTIN